jgi:uncharacterized surface protein with fasciclin (FAS1) repeats
MKNMKQYSTRRRGILTTAFVALLSQLPLLAANQDLATFATTDSLKSWVSVNDGVMGGVSKGGIKRTEQGTLLFSGELSLENSGGFASIRTKPSPLDLSGRSAIAVKAKGDGRVFWVELRVANQMSASSYRADLPTTAGEWQETVIPLKNFKLQAFGRKLPAPPIDLSKVDSVGFTLADKKAGPFELEVESVKALSEEALPATERPVKSKGGKSIVDIANDAGSFKTLLAAAAAAGLADALAGEGPFTVLAPTDEAFAKLPKGTVEELLKPENREKLAGVLKYHVIAGSVNLAKALEVGEAATLQGAKITAKFEDGRVRIGAATLIKADLAASNGIIHVIDQVLLPPETVAKPLSPAALIELAIQRGVPLFNDGSPAACAAVYEITCEALRVAPGLTEPSRQDLAVALQETRAANDPRKRAWILRRALDRVGAGLGG